MAKSFQEFLAEKARDVDQVERRRRREEWIAAVDRLFALLRDWLKQSDPQEVLVLEPGEITKLEEGLGSYVVPSLKIRLGETEPVVRVIPVGRNVAGFVVPKGGTAEALSAEGRVDLANGARKYSLYRVFEGDQERWYAEDDRFEATLLDRDRFESILWELLS